MRHRRVRIFAQLVAADGYELTSRLQHPKDSRAWHDRDASRHRSYVGQVDTAKRNLTLHNILKIAEILEIDPGRLLRGPPTAQE